jgi:ceramide glucosyltransferase
VNWFGEAASVLAGCGAAYNLLAIAGALEFRRRNTLANYTPPVSILKPVRGRDARFYEAIRSHAVQKYPEFELIFGASDRTTRRWRILSASGWSFRTCPSAS